MRPVLESSTSSSQVPDQDEAAGAAQSPAKDKSPKVIEALLSRGAHICTVFAQMMTLVELIDKNKGENSLFFPSGCLMRTRRAGIS